MEIPWRFCWHIVYLYIRATMRTIIFIGLLLICSVARGQYYGNPYRPNPSIQNYVNQVTAFAYRSTYPSYRNYNYGYNNNYGYNYNYRRERPRRLTPAEKYQLRSQILAAKKQYEENLQAYYLAKRARRLDMTEDMTAIKEREEMLRQQGVLPPRKPSRIVIEGHEYFSYAEFKASPEAKDIIASWHQRSK
jgi:hypothetical protein